MLRRAIALADTGGIEALTMRKLGQELGVEAMSLYNHVANKDEILDGIVDLVFGEIELPARRGRLEDGDPAERDLGARRAPPPSVGEQPLESRAHPVPRRLRHTTRCSDSLREAGFSPG